MIIPEIINGVQFRTRRFTKEDNIQIRDMPDGTKALTGRAIVFNSLSESFGTTDQGKDFREKILPTACDNCLTASSDIMALWNHDSSVPLGRTAAGNLTLTKSSAGVDFELRLIDTTAATDLIKNIRAGIVTGCSFGFTMEGWDDNDPENVDFEEDDSLRTRIIKKIASIHEISMVTFPAYPATTVKARSLELAEKDPALKRFLSTPEPVAKVDFEASTDNLSLLQLRLEATKQKAKLCNI